MKKKEKSKIEETIIAKLGEGFNWRGENAHIGQDVGVQVKDGDLIVTDYTRNSDKLLDLGYNSPSDWESLNDFASDIIEHRPGHFKEYTEVDKPVLSLSYHSDINDRRNGLQGLAYEDILQKLEDTVSADFNQEKAYCYSLIVSVKNGDAEVMAENDYGVLVQNSTSGEYEFYTKFSKKDAVLNLNRDGLSPAASDDMKLLMGEMRRSEQTALRLSDKEPKTLTGIEADSANDLEILSHNLNGRYNVNFGDDVNHVATLAAVNYDGKGIIYLDGDYKPEHMLEVSGDSFRKMVKSYLGTQLKEGEPLLMKNDNSYWNPDVSFRFQGDNAEENAKNFEKALWKEGIPTSSGQLSGDFPWDTKKEFSVSAGSDKQMHQAAQRVYDRDFVTRDIIPGQNDVYDIYGEYFKRGDTAYKVSRAGMESDGHGSVELYPLDAELYVDNYKRQTIPVSERLQIPYSELLTSGEFKHLSPADGKEMEEKFHNQVKVLLNERYPSNEPEFLDMTQKPDLNNLSAPGPWHNRKQDLQRLAIQAGEIMDKFYANNTVPSALKKENYVHNNDPVDDVLMSMWKQNEGFKSNIFMGKDLFEAFGLKVKEGAKPFLGIEGGLSNPTGKIVGTYNLEQTDYAEKAAKDPKFKELMDRQESAVVRSWESVTTPPEKIEEMLENNKWKFPYVIGTEKEFPFLADDSAVSYGSDKIYIKDKSEDKSGVDKRTEQIMDALTTDIILNDRIPQKYPHDVGYMYFARMMNAIETGTSMEPSEMPSRSSQPKRYSSDPKLTAEILSKAGRISDYIRGMAEELTVSLTDKEEVSNVATQSEDVKRGDRRDESRKGGLKL